MYSQGYSLLISRLNKPLISNYFVILSFYYVRLSICFHNFSIYVQWIEKRLLTLRDSAINRQLKPLSRSILISWLCISILSFFLDGFFFFFQLFSWPGTDPLSCRSPCGFFPGHGSGFSQGWCDQSAAFFLAQARMSRISPHFFQSDIYPATEKKIIRQLHGFNLNFYRLQQFPTHF